MYSAAVTCLVAERTGNNSVSGMAMAAVLGVGEKEANEEAGDRVPESPMKRMRLFLELPPRPTKVQLKSHQVEHKAKLQGILGWRAVAMDSSPTGSGKTYVALAVAQALRLHPVVIAPVSVQVAWKKVMDDHNILGTLMGYEELRGSRRYGVKHPILNRTDEMTEAGTHVSKFAATESLGKLLDSGVLFIMDEFHACKSRTSSQHKAARAIVKAADGEAAFPVGRTAEDRYKARQRERAMVTRTALGNMPPLVQLKDGEEGKMVGRSRILLLSATPCDKPEYVNSVLRLLAVIRSRNLVRTYQGVSVWVGLQEAIEGCVGGEKSEAQVLEELGLPGAAGNHWDGTLLYYCYQRVLNALFDLYTKYGRLRLSSSMELPPVPRVKRDMATGVYPCPCDADTLALRLGVESLARATRYGRGHQGGEIDMREVNWGALTKALTEIESAKVRLFIHLVVTWCTRHPAGQVAVFMHYREPIRRVAEGVRALGFPVKELTGSVSKAGRNKLLNEFSSGETRVIVSTTTVGGVGLSMHDEHGGRPRLALISPSYSAIAMHQAAGRVWRVGTRSDVCIRVVFGVERMETEEEVAAAAATDSKALQPLELQILSALGRKAVVMRGVLAPVAGRNGLDHSHGYGVSNQELPADDDGRRVVFPGEYRMIRGQPTTDAAGHSQLAGMVATKFDEETGTNIGKTVLLAKLGDMLLPQV